jgi:hypothetical protein
MTEQARRVLLDCHYALNLLEKETDPDLWRVHWAGALALLRAVGHVLDKVDGKDPLVAKVSRDLFQRWKKERQTYELFNEFIERDRNLLLKEYEFNVHPDDKVEIALITRAISSNGDEITLGETHQLDENIYRPILEGPRQGDDARDVYQEALDWWGDQIELIDRLVTELRH